MVQKRAIMLGQKIRTPFFYPASPPPPSAARSSSKNTPAAFNVLIFTGDLTAFLLVVVVWTLLGSAIQTTLTVWFSSLPYAERFMRTIKEEEVDLSEYNDFTDAYHQIGVLIQDVYITKRIHSALGYVTLAEFKNAWWRS